MFTIKTKNGVLSIKKEIVVVLIMDIFALAYWLTSRKLSSTAMMFPNVLLIGVVITSLLCIKNDIRFQRAKQEDPEEAGAEADAAPGFGISKKLVAFIILTVATLLLFHTLGAILSLLVFLVAAMLILGVRNKWVLIIVPVVIIAFVFCVFKLWLKVPLPAGILSFLQ